MEEKSFKNLNLEKEMLDVLSLQGYKHMTPIQQKSLPYILDKKDLIAKAKTGSGKSVSFSLGVLKNLDTQKYRIQSLVICPTRELASQVADTIKKLARFKHNIKVLTLSGGVPYKPQVHSLSHQAHIVVGTPGRVLKHLENDNFKTEDINTLVFDEADRMLDMGFYDDIMKIVDYIPKDRHTMLFSATYPKNIDSLAKTITKDAVFLEADKENESSFIKQNFYKTTDENKDFLISKCFKKEYKSVMIFCNTKIKCDQLADFLENQYDMEPLVLHSDLEQNHRDETLILFENKSYPVLIATDVASRGLDIQDVDLVINYDMPENFEVYTHRIGRTARAGKDGESISFCNDIEYFEDLNEYLGNKYKLNDTSILEKNDTVSLDYEYSTIYISGGKKLKLRAGDILGALTAGIGLEKNDVGKISILDRCSYVAIKNDKYEKAYEGLRKKKIKNKDFRVYKR